MLLILLIGVAFAGCEYAIEDPVVGNYYMVATDTGEQCGLSYKDSDSGYGGVIRACVYAVGFNDNYIIAKQHPYEHGKELDKSITNYFILPLKRGMNYRTMNGLIGPLTMAEFNQKSKELSIDNLEFSMVYDYME